jgi:hypothetical protein
VHVDAYRLRDGARPAGGALLDLDLELALEDGSWSSSGARGWWSGLADSRLEVLLDRPADADPDTRRVTVACARAQVDDRR